MFEAIPFIFITTRGFNIGQVGLVFIGVGVGTTIGAYITIRLSNRYNVLIPKYRGFPPPEERLYGAMIGAPSLVIGAFYSMNGFQQCVGGLIAYGVAHFKSDALKNWQFLFTVRPPHLLPAHAIAHESRLARSCWDV